VLAFERPAIEQKMAVLARALDLPQAGFEGVAAWIMDLRSELAIPQTLAAMGIDASRADEIARAALADPSTPSNPVPLSEDVLRALFLKAHSGA
jgi:alcohol dehydrogenase class IV